MAEKKTINFPGVDLESIVSTMTEAGVELGEAASEVARNADLTSWILIASDGTGNLSLSLSKRFPGSVSRLQEAIGKLEMAKSIIMSVLQSSLREQGPVGPTLVEEEPKV